MIFFKIYWHLNAFMRKLFLRIIYWRKLNMGESVAFRKGFTLLIDRTAKVHIGNRVFFNNYCSVVAMDDIYIGDDCIFGENVKIYDHNHRFNVKNKAVATQGFKTVPIIIKDNC
jgi:acetyltransferase-like isoleucine patch superfamily enzyme